VKTYSDQHVKAQVDKDTAAIRDPMGDNFRLFNRQVIADPSEIGEEVQNLRASRQCRGEKLTQSQWEVQGGDQE
jgi:hypothetical protein